MARPSYALANKQNSGCYSISLSSAPNEEWKEVGESGAVKKYVIFISGSFQCCVMEYNIARYK